MKLKLLLFLGVTLCLILPASAQVSINNNGNTPDPSAMLDVASTEKGILVPRMTMTEREGIQNPATALLVYDIDTGSFWYYENGQWNEIGGGAFQSINGITSAINNNDDFVVGADSLNKGAGFETKLFFDKGRGALRAGQITDGLWDNSNLGLYSFAAGADADAANTYSVAFGSDTHSRGLASFVAGQNSEANGTSSTAFGSNTEAEGAYSFAVGRSNDAKGRGSNVMGGSSIAHGDYANAFGYYANAISYGETTIGVFNTTYAATDTFAFHTDDRLFVIGNGRDNGNRSDALRIYKNGNAELNGALTIDSAYTLPIVDGTMGQVLTTDGNGQVNWAEKSTGAFSSRDGITNSTSNNDDFVFGADSLNHGIGNETKFFFAKGQGAFRVGQVNNANWDAGNIGNLSFAGGNNSKASGLASFAYGATAIAEGEFSIALGTLINATGDHAIAIGENSTASGMNATVLGNENIASGVNSLAMGYKTSALGLSSTVFGFESAASGQIATAFGWDNQATGDYSTVFGWQSLASGAGATAFGVVNVASAEAATVFGMQSLASGKASSAFGFEAQASSFAETAIGTYSTSEPPLSTTGFEANDRLFVVGNGRNIVNRSDALRIYKNGNVELNGALTIDSSYTFPVVDGTAGQLLTTNGNGAVSWISPTDQDNQTVDNFQLSGTTLNLSLENDGQQDYTVNLSSLKDDLGNHAASQNIRLSDNWISNDGGNEGLKIENDGDVQLGGNLLVGTNSIRFNNDSWGTAFSFSDIGPNDFEILIPQSIITDEGIQLNGSWMSNDGGNEGLTIDTDGHVSTSNNLGVGGALSAQNSLSLFNGNQNVVLVADDANRRVILDVGGSGASSDAFIIGDLTSGVNEVLMLGNVGIGTFSTPQKLTVGARGDGTKAVANEWDTWSDKRLKRNIEEIQNPLKKLAAINGYYYYWTKDMSDQSKQIGVIAQEIEAVLPELVTTNPDGYKSVDYTKLSALLIEVNQAQEEKLALQSEQLQRQQTEIKALQTQVAKINQLEVTLNQLQTHLRASTSTHSSSTK